MIEGQKNKLSGEAQIVAPTSMPATLCQLAEACISVMDETSVRGHVWAWR